MPYGAPPLCGFARVPELSAETIPPLVDQSGQTARRHTPRPGTGRHERSGTVVGFLGGACAMRRSSYLSAGGYWGDLFYGHEELELSWRLIDRGGLIQFLAEERVFHPRTPIGRHACGWWFTGRNRVWIARRTLPVPVAVVHALAWLIVGTSARPRPSLADGSIWLASSKGLAVQSSGRRSDGERCGR